MYFFQQVTVVFDNLHGSPWVGPSLTQSDLYYNVVVYKL